MQCLNIYKERYNVLDRQEVSSRTRVTELPYHVRGQNDKGIVQFAMVSG